MKTPHLVLGVILASITMVGSSHGQESPNPAEHVENQFLVSFETRTDAREKSLAHVVSKAEVVDRFDEIDADLVELKEGNNPEAALQTYRLNPHVKAVEPNSLRRPHGVTPNDPEFPNQWSLLNTGQTVSGDPGILDADMDASEPTGSAGWDVSTGSSSTIVAIVDTGIQITHPDLAANIWTNLGEVPSNGVDDDRNGYIDDINGWDFGHNDNSVYDPAETCGQGAGADPVDEHGTHLAGVIGAVGNNSLGIAGVNWQVKIMPLKFIVRQSDGECSGSDADAIEAISYATRMGARVINASWGGAEDDSALRSAFVSAGNAGAVFGVSAGNTGLNLASFPNYPASWDLENQVVAAASNNNDGRPSFSSFGGPTDLAAPGATVLSTLPVNTYGYLSGTSMSAAFTSGALALLKTLYPNASPSQLRSRLVASVDQKSAFAQPVTSSGGRLNLNLTLSCSHLAGDLFPFTGFTGGLYVAAGDLNGDGCDEVIVGPDAGGEPRVRVFTGDGLLVTDFLAYPAGFSGGVRVAAGDLDGDSRDELITAAGPGGGPHVRWFDLVDSSIVDRGGLFAYPDGFYGGVFVAAGNVGGPDSKAEIITGAGESGGPHVRIFSNTGADLGGLFAYPDGFYGGVRVAAGNVVGGGPAEIITGAGPTGGSHVRIFSLGGADLGGFFAYPDGFYGGVFVGSGSLVSGGADEIVTGAGETGGSHVRVFSSGGADLGGFFAYPDGFYGGVRVATSDLDKDGNFEILTGPGPSGGPHVRIIE
jgi:hypothetical protein